MVTKETAAAAAPSADWDAWAKGVQASVDAISKRVDDIAQGLHDTSAQISGKVEGLESDLAGLKGSIDTVNKLAQAPASGKAAKASASGGSDLDARLARAEMMLGLTNVPAGEEEEDGKNTETVKAA